MNNTGHSGEKNGYKVILLLVVGLTAFSSAMKELNQLQQFSLQATQLVAQWSEKFAPAEVPAVPDTTEAQPLIVKVESCEIKQSALSIELPWLSNAAPVTPPAPRAVVPRPSQAIDVAKNLPKPSEFQFARLKKLPQFDPAQFDFTIASDDDPDAETAAEIRAAHVKAKTRRMHELRIQSRDREILLKSLNRSINLRIAS